MDRPWSDGPFPLQPALLLVVVAVTVCNVLDPPGTQPRPVNPTDPSDNSERTSRPPAEPASHDGGAQVNTGNPEQTVTEASDQAVTPRSEPVLAMATESISRNVNGAAFGDEAAFDVAAEQTLTLTHDVLGISAVASGRPPPELWLSGTSVRRLAEIDRRLAKSLLLQGVIAVAVLGMWLLGKLSWNHDPLVSSRYRAVDVNVHSNRAQNAALEFHHDLTAGLFGQARLLVAEEAENLVDDAVAACQPSAPCASEERVFSRATLLSSSGQAARASVETFTRDGKLVSQGAYELSHVTGRWLVTARVAP